MSDILRKILKEKMQELIPGTVVMATVESVDEENFSIDVKQSDNGLDIYGVRLIPAIGSAANSVVCVPAIGSLALVGMIHNLPAANYMIMCQECSRVIINGGQFGGLIKVGELQKQMKKDSDILKALLDVVSGPALLQPPNAPSVLQAALKAKMSVLQKGDYKDIENKNVIHG